MATATEQPILIRSRDALERAGVSRMRDAQVVRRRVTVSGAVQGVGFRPFVFRLAEELGLAGFVGNDASGAFAEVEGPADAVERFEQRLMREAPPLARVEAVRALDTSLTGESGFTIVESVPAAGQGRSSHPTPRPARPACRRSPIPPTAATAIRSPTAPTAGPGSRSSATLPYDRPATTMAGFDMCASLRRRVRGSPRPSPPRPADLLPRLRAAAAVRRRGDVGHRHRCGDRGGTQAHGQLARSSPSKASAATT